MTERHHGVVVIAANPARTRFFVQQKDEDYPAFPLGYSLFGGRIEPGEAPETALARELHEELGDGAEVLLAGRGPEHVLTTEVSESRYVVSLFEAIVADEVLEALAGSPVREGKRGALFGRAELLALPFIWDLKAVVRAYLERRDARGSDA